MGKFVYFLMCLTVILHTSTALKCYDCQSENADGCKLKHAKLTERECGKAAPTFQSVCAYKVFYDSSSKKYDVTASCEQISEASAVDKKSLSDCDPNKSHMEIKECRVCNKDLCNSAPILHTTALSTLLLPLLYFVTKYILN